MLLSITIAADASSLLGVNTEERGVRAVADRSNGTVEADGRTDHVAVNEYGVDISAAALTTSIALMKLAVFLKFTNGKFLSRRVTVTFYWDEVRVQL